MKCDVVCGLQVVFEAWKLEKVQVLKHSTLRACKCDVKAWHRYLTSNPIVPSTSILIHPCNYVEIDCDHAS